MSNFHNMKILKNIKTLKVTNLLKKSGDQGWYQKKILCLFALLIYLVSFQSYYQPFIFHKSSYLCYTKKGTLYSCDANTACNNPYSFELDITRKSLVDKYNLICDREYIISVIQTSVYFISAVFCSIFSILSDFYSRKKILVLGGIFFVLSNCFLFWDNLVMVMIGLVIQTLGYNLVISILYVYYNEVMSNKLRNRTSGLIFTCWVFGSYSLAFITLFILDFWDLFLISTIVSFLCLWILTYFKETPFLLFSKQEYVKLYYNLIEISKENNINNKKIQESIKKNLKKQMFLDPNINLNNLNLKEVDYKKKKSTKKFTGYYNKIFMITLLTVCVRFLNGMFDISAQFLGTDSLFINISIPNIGEILGLILMSKISFKTKRKNFFQIYLIIIYILCGILLSLTIFNIRNYTSVKYFELFISFLLKFNLAMSCGIIFTYISEIFPTKIRGFAFGFSLLIARIAISTCSFFLLFANRNNIHPLVFCLIFAVFAQISLFFLPETYKSDISN